MNNLGETAIVARKAIKYGGIGLVVLMVGRIILSAGISIYKRLNPPPPPPPDVKFGKLPKLEFPQKEVANIGSYTLETKTGGLPNNLPEQFKVYFMPIKKANLLAYDAAKAVAGRLDFIAEPSKLSETEYRWDTSEPINSSLTMNIITGAFVLDRKWTEDPSYLTPTIYYSETQATDRMTNLLSRLDLLPEDIVSGKSTVQPLKASNDQIVSAPSISQAHFVRVNLYRAPVDDVTVVSPRVDRGLITGIMALQREDDKQFVNLDYNYYPVDLERYASYPLIGVAEAWQRLQKGSAYFASARASATSVAIREVTLAYYDSETPQQFLQPVYVFSGDPEFVAYVPALADAWVE